MHGAGNLVLDYRESGGIDLIGYLAGLALESRNVPVSLLAELLELRRLIATEVVGLAAERATDAELAELAVHVHRQRGLIGEPVEYMKSDLAFARALVRSCAARNIAYELTVNTVIKVIDQNPALELAYYANAEQTVQVYARLVELMQKRDAVRARQVTERLLERLDRRTVEAITALKGAAGSSTAG